jgi:2-oxoglutarate ferredoxin oxidoreductase subunit gamma
MQREIIISGFGGQGSLFAGQLLAYAALASDLHTTWYPSYGPEMRGGTAHCIVIIADEPIGSPVVKHPQAAIVMNIPSLERYEPLVVPGGVLVVNSALVDRKPTRRDLDIALIPADTVAEKLGDKRLANVVLVGALLARLPVLSLEVVAQTLRERIPAHRRNLLEANVRALYEGAALASPTPA